MLRTALCFIYFLPILAYGIPTCIRHTEGYDYAELAFATDNNYQLVPNMNIIIRDEEILYKNRKCIALDVKTEATTQPKTFNPKKVNRKQRFMQIYLKDMWREYSVKRQYRFAVPDVTAKCKCYCNETSQCGYYYEDEGPNITNNAWNDEINYGIYRHNDKKCEGSDYQGSVCCEVTVKGDYRDTLRGIYFESERTHYDMEIGLIDKEGREIISDRIRFSTDIYSVSFNNKSGEMTVTENGDFQKLPPQWGLVHPEKESEIRINSRFNDVNETSVEKVGWYKWTSDGKFRMADPMDIRDAFMPHVRNCTGNKVDWDFHARGWKGHRDDGDLLEKYYDFIESVEYNSDKKVVNIRHKVKPRIRVGINLKIEFGHLFELKYSNFTGFKVRFDSNELLVDIQNAYGKLSLVVRSYNGRKRLLTRTFLVPTLNLLNYTKKLDFRGMEEWGKFFDVCLSTVGRSPKLQRCISSLSQISVRFSMNSSRFVNRTGVPYYDSFKSNGSSMEKRYRFMFLIYVLLFQIPE